MHPPDMQSAPDLTVHVRSDNASSERRISPSWTIAQFKTRLEPITGVPSTSQSLSFQLSDSQPRQPIHSSNEDATQLSSFPLQQYAQVFVGWRFPFSCLMLDRTTHQSAT